MAPDLDGRPGEPARSTLRRWVLTCRSCGACAPDLAALPAAAAAILQDPLYKDQASPTLRWALICERLGDINEAAQAVLQAAWAADDAGEAAVAQAHRRRAAALWAGSHDTPTMLRRVDVLRRAGDFAAASQALAEVPTQDESHAAIIAYQRARIAAADAGAHLISSALRPPARTPHVAHGKPQKRGFLAALFAKK
jgi:hypothetical protein